MHIVIGLLGTIITILILLNRLAEAGIDLGGLNPFLWNRRRKWKNQYNGDPIFKLSKPIDITALLMVGVAKSDGDMSSEEKKIILDMFQSEFHLSKREASELMIASVYLLKDGSDLRSNLIKILSPSQPNFTEEQSSSAISLIQRVSNIDTTTNENKSELVSKIVGQLTLASKESGKWQ